MFDLGFTTYWDTYFAGRAAVLGSSVPAGVVQRALLQRRSTAAPCTSGRIHHLPTEQLTDLIDMMTARGLVEDEATFTPTGRQAKDRVEALTDELAVAPYEVLEAAELDDLVTALEPLARKLVLAQDRA